MPITQITVGDGLKDGVFEVQAPERAYRNKSQKIVSEMKLIQLTAKNRLIDEMSHSCIVLNQMI